MTETTLGLVYRFRARDRGLVEATAATAPRGGRSAGPTSAAAGSLPGGRFLRHEHRAQERDDTQRKSQRCTWHEISSEDCVASGFSRKDVAAGDFAQRRSAARILPAKAGSHTLNSVTHSTVLNGIRSERVLQ
jgi:hypothetical protein